MADRFKDLDLERACLSAGGGARIQEGVDSLSGYGRIAAEAVHVDDVIRPSTTRRQLIDHLELLRAKHMLRPDRKHGNMPL